MFSLKKRLIASLLIFAMIFANAGMSTLAVSISHYVDEAKENAKDDSDIKHRYYDEWRYSYESKTTLLMNSGDANASPQDGAGTGAEKSGANEKETTGISETNGSDFGVENNENETGISEETGSSDFDVENEESETEEESETGARETCPDDES